MKLHSPLTEKNSALIELINDQKLAEKADHLGECLFQLVRVLKAQAGA